MAEFVIPALESRQCAFHIMLKATFDLEFSIMAEDVIDCLLWSSLLKQRGVMNPFSTYHF